MYRRGGVMGEGGEVGGEGGGEGGFIGNFCCAERVLVDGVVVKAALMVGAGGRRSETARIQGRSENPWGDAKGRAGESRGDERGESVGGRLKGGQPTVRGPRGGQPPRKGREEIVRGRKRISALPARSFFLDDRHVGRVINWGGKQACRSAKLVRDPLSGWRP